MTIWPQARTGVRRSSPLRLLLSLAPVLLAAGCAIRLPDPSALRAMCPKPSESLEALAPNALFFAAFALPDCGKGMLDFAGYRVERATLGQAGMLTAPSGGKALMVARGYTEDAWRTLLRQRIDAGGSRLIVYIHGYNTDFRDSIEAASKLSALAPGGVPVLVLRWPSRHNAQNYIYDEDAVLWAQDGIERTIAEAAGLASDVTVVAHSMGARAAIAALRRLDTEHASLGRHVKRLVLASADVDRQAALMPGGAIDGLLKPGRKVLVYASSVDHAMQLSRHRHGYERLGSASCAYDADPGLRLLGPDGHCAVSALSEGLSLVETSLVHSQKLAHSDYVDSCAVRLDLSAFLKDARAFALRRPIERDGMRGEILDPALIPAGACSK